MRGQKLLIVTEANERVASGHLSECITCRDYLQARGIDTALMVNEDMPGGLKSRIKGGCLTYQSDIQKEQDFFIGFLKRSRYQTILFNLREIGNGFVRKIKENIPADIICIDEFGGRTLDADVIINPMIDESYWDYDTEAEVYCGHQYLVLPHELQGYRAREKRIRERVKRVTVSMGGVDCGNSTIKLAGWLPKLDRELEINLVLGGGYPGGNLLKKKVQRNEKIHIFQNIPCLARLFFESDLAFCAGGNTLHELAVIGTPTIVIPSMPHEEKNGKAYERNGFSFCGSGAGGFGYEELESLYGKLSHKSVRMEMYKSGRSLADGKGCERICGIILQRQGERHDNSNLTGIQL